MTLSGLGRQNKNTLDALVSQRQGQSIARKLRLAEPNELFRVVHKYAQ